MKKLIYYTALAGLSLNSHAQSVQAGNMTINTYQVEQDVFYEITGCIPASDVSLYSEKSGGVLLQTVTTDATGRALVKGNKKFTPALALSRGTPNRQGIRGNGKVCFTGDKEFILSGLEVKQNNGNNTIRFTAAIDPGADISFEIWRSEDGMHYTNASTLPGQQALNAVPYTYTELAGRETSHYQVRVTSKSKGHRYTANLAVMQKTGAVTVYPSVTDDRLQITLYGSNSGTYRLLGSNGQIVRSGSLLQQESTISIRDLSAGMYIMVVQTADQISKTPVVKQ